MLPMSFSMGLVTFLTIFLICESTAITEVFDLASDLVLMADEAWNERINAESEGLVSLKIQEAFFNNFEKISIRINDSYLKSSFRNMIKNISSFSNFPLLERIRRNQAHLNRYYYYFEKIIKPNFRLKDVKKWKKFSYRILSDGKNSVKSLISSTESVTFKELLQTFEEYFQKKIYCKEERAPQQVFLNIMEIILESNLKSYVLIQFAYLLLEVFEEKNHYFTALDYTGRFTTKINSYVQFLKLNMSDLSREIWRCNPKKHILHETYVALTNFVRGYVINQIDLSPKKQCYEQCDNLSNRKSAISCDQDKWCYKNEPVCQKILQCDSLQNNAKICLGNQQHRRYESIVEKDGRVFGKSKSCKNVYFLENYLKTMLFWDCDYCFCLCEEDPKNYSVRYINLRAVISNVENNMVVTGVRFVERNRIIHLQIQEGKLQGFGQIDPRTIRWVPIDDYHIRDLDKHEGLDYHKISWEERAINLITVNTFKGFLVTGLRLKKLDLQRLDLEIKITSFNFTTGSLYPSRTKFKSASNIFNLKFGKELKLLNPDNSSLDTTPSVPNNSANYIKFTNTDWYKDAAQTTVPFFDAQPVESVVPAPLAGVGIYYKGREGFGGFLAPKIVVYDLCSHVNYLEKVE